MAVLKMGDMFEDMVWVPDVDKVIQRFFVQRHMETCSWWELLIMSLHKSDRKDILQDLADSVGNFPIVAESHKGEATLLKVYRRSPGDDAPRVEMWLAPVKGIYLMSDDGKTIDRL